MKRKRPNKDPYAKREASKYENPVPSREYILQCLEDASVPVTFEKLVEMLNLVAEDELEAIARRVRAMHRDGQVITNRLGELIVTGKTHLVRGRVQGHRDGFGFLIPADGSSDLYLSSRQMRRVFDGDEVVARPGDEFRGKRDGVIIEIIARNTRQVVGRLDEQGGSFFVRPDNPRNNHDLVIPHEELAGAQVGQFVVVEILQQPERNQKPVGRITEVLGDHMAPGMEIDVAIRSHGIPHTWPADVEKQTAMFTAEVKEEDKLHRVDLRHLPLITIDGEDARDFDDAVYCETKPNGGWRLYVAIADVSHYVAPGSALDQEALVRGNSVYFPDHVVPMLPQVLSNGLCSLNPHVDRLCMVCEMTISASGKVSGFQFYEAVMHSQARMTYTNVGEIIAAKGTKKSAIRKEYEAIVPVVDELHAMYQVLKQARSERGAIEFHTNETRIIFDAERKIEKIIPVQRNDAHKLIEECMLAANVCAAKFLEGLEIPALYRVHESPSEEKLEMLYEFLASVGLLYRNSGDMTPQTYNDILTKAHGRPDANIIQTVMLRSMNQARYQPENHGHFGLSYPAYAHFTSPIRRYPDLIVHRAIRGVIRSDIQTRHVKRLETTRQEGKEKHYPYGIVDMVNFGEQCSTTERRADEATRDVVSWLKCEYLKERVGEEFNGVISAVTAFGVFVELEGLYIEGLVHITSLPHDYYNYEAAQHMLEGERTRKTFRLGDGVRVCVARVDLDERKIDFDFIKSTRSSKKVREVPVESVRKVRKRPAKSAKKIDSVKSNPKTKNKEKPKTKAKTKSKPAQAKAKTVSAKPKNKAKGSAANRKSEANTPKKPKKKVKAKAKPNAKSKSKLKKPPKKTKPKK